MQRAPKASFGFVLLVVLAACSGGPPSQTSPPPASAGPTQTPGGQPTTTAAPTLPPSPVSTGGAFPATIMGMPVMTVAAADAALAAGQLDGRFAAVGGYWRQYALPCPFPMHMPDIYGFCSGGEFADSPQDENTSGGIGGNNVPVAMPETMNGDLLWSDASESPARVVLIVHARDSRAWQCAPDPGIDCKQHMVIDDVAWVNGSATAPGTTISESGVQPTMTLDQVAAIAVKPGEQLVTAYALPATHLNVVDPRLLGKGSGVVWLMRTAAIDGSGDGTIRLVSDADGSVIDALPLAVDAAYNPARLVLDSQYSNNSADTGPHFELLDGTTVLAADVLNIGSPPLAVEAGNYVLHAYLTDAPQPSGPTCDQPITLATGANAAYKASFTGSTCKWAPFDPTQF